MEIKDSGQRREFSTGAVRDVAEGKGRCDLMPIDVIAPLMPKQSYANVLHHISMYLEAGYSEDLYRALYNFAEAREWSVPAMLLEVSKHYEAGAEKYGEYNWQKGIPLHCYIDSAVRHFLKFVNDDTDEPHDRAFVWNILGALWTQANLPSMTDLPFPQRPVTSDERSVRCDDLDMREDEKICVNRDKLLRLLESLELEDTISPEDLI